MASVVRFTSAVALLDRFPALTGVDLDVGPGEIVLIEGPNGAGKTTLLRACAGLVPVTDGAATVLGHDLRTDRRAVRRLVGLLGHRPTLYDDLTVRENVAFFVAAAGVRGGDGRRATAPAAVDAALGRLALDGRLANTRAGRLSAGQRRRAALAAIVARAPALWLLDEPFSSLDRPSRDALRVTLRDTVAATGATVLIASHDPVDIATRRVRMAGGRIAPVQEPAGVP